MLLVSLLAKRFGNFIGAVIAAFPIVAGPINLFLAIDHGNAFAAISAKNTLGGMLPYCVFALAYSWSAIRLNWACCSVIALVLNLAASQFLISLDLSLAVMSAIAFAALWLSTRFFPVVTPAAPRAEISGAETLLRILCAEALLLGVTHFAEQVGPSWSGALAIFPIIGWVIALFTHHYQGASEAINVLRGLVRGFFSFWVFFTVVAMLIEHSSVAQTFTLAFALAALAHTLSIRSLARRA